MVKNYVNEKFNICIFISNLHYGGAERVAVNLANNFIERGYAVDMVLAVAEGEFIADLHKDIRIIDLQVKRLIRSLLPLTAYLREVQPCAMLACMWPLTVIAIWAKILACVQTRIIVVEHTTWSRSELLNRYSVKWQIKMTMHLTFPKANGIVAVSQGAAYDLSKFSNLEINSIFVIYNPVVCGKNNRTNKINYSIQKIGWLEGNHHKIIAVGMLKPSKDYATMLIAFSLLRKKNNACLLIIGDGECRCELEKLSHYLGISEYVFMFGATKDVASYYQQADLHVLSSITEGLPTVLIEALSFGLPVVSTDCPSGPREILMNGKYGHLVPVGNAAAMAEAMADSLSSEHDRAALMDRAKDFSVDKAASSYLKLLLPPDKLINSYL